MYTVPIVPLFVTCDCVTSFLCQASKNMSFQREYAEPERDRHHVPGLCGTAGPPWKCDVFAEKEFEKFRVLQDRSYQSDFDRLRGLFQ